MKMLDKLLSSKSIRNNGTVVYDSGDNEQTCVVFRHYHGSKATPKRLAEDKKFEDAFFAHQEEVLNMARTLLGGMESSLLVEGMRKDKSRPSPSYLNEISRRDAQKRRQGGLNPGLPTTQRDEGFFMNHELDRTLAGFRAAAFIKSNHLPNRLFGIEPNVEELGQIVVDADPNFGFFEGNQVSEDKIAAAVQRAKNDAIIRGFMEGAIATGILIIGASHTKHGTLAPDLGLECIEDLFQSRQQPVRVVVIEPKTPVWTY